MGILDFVCPCCSLEELYGSSNEHSGKRMAITAIAEKIVTTEKLWHYGLR